MLKKTFSIFFAFLIIFLCVFSPVCASAYEITSFEITAKAGMLVSLDTGEALYEKIKANITV